MVSPTAATPVPFCTTSGTNDSRATWKPFRFPPGLEYFRSSSLPCEPNAELGTSDSWLPVTHVGGPMRGPTDSGGLWFYYARGCSDLQWNVGRSVLARNRAHAAVLTEQMLAVLESAEHSTSAHEGERGHQRRKQKSPPTLISDREAVGRVAAWLRKRYPKVEWSPLRQARPWFHHVHQSYNATAEDLIAEAARGLYGQCTPPAFDQTGALRPCTCASDSPSRGTSRRRLLALTPLCGDKVLSLHSEPGLRRLPLDTVVLHQQPQGGGNPSWTTEIWDVRGSPSLSRHLENASAHPEVVGRARWAPLQAEGWTVPAGACVPAESWHTCFSCKGSALEHGCNATVRLYEKKGQCLYQKLHNVRSNSNKSGPKGKARGAPRAASATPTAVPGAGLKEQEGERIC
jgi:hypothetical protein